MKKLMILSFCVLGLFAFSQKTHTVVAKDNPYNIAKKYGISLDELFKLNPTIKDGKLNIGDVLMINKKAVVAPKTTIVEQVASKELGKIALLPKQTIYGITKQYHITEQELRKLNPDLDNHMKIGDLVTLPLANIKKYGGNNAIESAKEEPKPLLIKSDNTEISGDKYVIQPKDNYYKITKMFNISQQELFHLNPGLEEKGLQPGETIVVKTNKSTVAKENKNTIQEKPKEIETNKAFSDDYQTYTVQSGDTVFGILNKFNVSLDQLLELNPSLANGLNQGMVLKIKKLDVAYVKKSGDALNVVLMLPFGFDDGESKYRSMAADFLTGAKLAIERNASLGQKLDVKIVDSGSEQNFKNSLSQINQNNTDLIVGPFFKSNVLEVLDYVKNQKIPVVSPFANSDELKGFNNLVIIETDQKVFADRVVKEVSQVYSDQKIYIITGADKTHANYLKNGLEKELKNANVILVNSALDIQLDQNMMTGQKAPVISILATDNDDEGTVFAKKLMEMSKDVDHNKSFSMYYHSSFEKNTDALSQASLVYLMDRKINTKGDFEQEILEDYKKKYCKSPAKYAVIGFDVMNDMLSRENKKGELFKQMNKSQTQLATKFEFEKIKNGAYVNTGYRVVRLVPEN